MLDLLAAIVSADPPSLLAWLVLAFAAGMYPIGIMLGSTCSPCCASPCSGPCAKNEDCLPGCECVGGQCGGSLPCVPCQYCAPSCLEVEFSGFSHGTGNCGECDYLEDATFITKRPPVTGASIGVSAVDVDGPDANTTANGSGATFGFVGISIQGQMTNMARRQDGSYYVTGVPVVNKGQNYDSPVLNFTVSNFIQCRPPLVEAQVEAGRIERVVVVEGGVYWPTNSCGYSSASDPVCAVCPMVDSWGDGLNKRELRVSVSIGATSNSVTLYLRDWYQYGISPPGFTDTAIVSASRSSVDAQGNPIPCNDFTFSGEHITLGCPTNGTITLRSVGCDSESIGYCESEGNMPEQITLSLSGMGGLAIGNNVPFQGPCRVYDENGNIVGFRPYEQFCGECGDASYNINIVQGFANASTQSLVQQDFEAVLDREESAGCFWLWSGFAPAPPSETTIGNTGTFATCNGELTVPVSVSIGPVGLETTVIISAPTKAAGVAATAEASVSSPEDGGEITGVTLLTPGSGYAREIFARTQPGMTASVSGNVGSGATFSVTLSQNGQGEQATWSVSSVAVTSGGAGYPAFGYLTFTPEQGAATASGAAAQFVSGRTQPTVTASATGGTGATLPVTLAQGTDWWTGQAYWYVDAVSVTNGGSGYINGAQVVFTVTDGQADFVAAATITTGVEEPSVSATVSGTGAGATITPTLTQSGNRWGVTSAAITTAGSGYSEWDYIEFTSSDVTESAGYAYVTSVNANGGITALTIYSGGSYYRDSGVIESVQVSWGGSYFKSTGIIEGVQVSDGGAYYIETPTGTSDVDVPTVSFRSNIATVAATATATVDGTVGSPTFGQITGITVTSGGQRYREAGTGFLLTINAGLNHLETLLGDEIPPEPVGDDPLHCNNFWDRNQRMGNRVSTEPCPADLLSRSYVMSVGGFSLPFGDPYGDGMEEAVWCRTPQPDWGGSPSATFFEFGNGEITVALSPGDGEEEENPQ